MIAALKLLVLAHVHMPFDVPRRPYELPTMKVVCFGAFRGRGRSKR